MNATGFADHIPPTHLPDGWVWVPLTDVARLNPPLDLKPTHDDQVVCFVPMAAVGEDFAGLQRSELRTYGQVKKGYTPFQSGDVIMAKITPCMENGKGGIVHGGAEEIFFGSTEFHVFRPNAGIEAKWIGAFLAQERVRRAARLGMKGSAGQLRVPTAFFENLYLPLPPADEQARIIDRLDELFADLSAGVTALERVKRKLVRYRATVLHAAVTGRLLPPRTKDWSIESEWIPIGNVIGEIEQGWSPKCEREATHNESEWAVMTTTAIQPMKFHCWENKRLPSHLTPAGQYEIHVGDILITRAGPRGRCGIACLVKECRPNLILCDKAYRFHCLNNDYVIPEFIELVLNARPITDSIERMKTGSSDSGLNLTQSRFRSLRIPIPSKAEQIAIVNSVQEKLSQIESLESEIANSAKKANSLRQSILKMAFEGKLSQRAENDESVDILLDRIKSEKGRTPQKRVRIPSKRERQVAYE